ncbi:glycosyltransferase family 2 protein [candidate division KSB1 bacterium]|nr:glycosyltransferase family 2 protein [candidate division KSB1 bacterium]
MTCVPKECGLSQQPLVSVIILNYNGLKFLPGCLESLARSNYQPIEVAVVDNCSNDGSLEYLRRHHPSVQLFPLDHNLGYSGAYNAVLDRTTGKYAVLLNFDVEVEPAWLDQAIALLEAEPTLAAVQPKLKSFQNREMLEYSGGSGGFIDRYGYPFVRGRVFDTVERDEHQYDDVIPIHWATGAALIIRRDAYYDVGGLDSDFFLHMEELDLCWRLWLAGWTVKVAPRGVVYHWAGAALSAERYHKMYYNHRNSLVMMLKNLGAPGLWRNLTVRWMLDWVTVVASPVKREPKRSLAVLAAHFYVLRNLRNVFRKRRAVQRLRKVADHDLQHVIFPHSVIWRYYFHNQKLCSQLLNRW